MADPFSIAAGVVGVVSLTIQITEDLVKFYSSYQNRNENITKTLRKLRSLGNILDNLSKLLQYRQYKADDAKQQRQVEESVENCGDIARELESELQKFNSSSKEGLRAAGKAFGRRIAYPYRQSTLQKLDEDVTDLRNNLQFALDVLQLKRVDDILGETEDLSTAVQRIRKTQISDAVQNWLKAPDASSNHNDACRTRHPQTGSWFVTSDSFRQWLEQDASFLWMYGLAGSGKTVLCSTIVLHTLQHCSGRSKRLSGVAFYYFTFADDSKQNASGMLRSLLLQLSTQLDIGESILSGLYDRYRPGEPDINALQSALKEMVERFRDVYILLDALDESPQGGKRDAVLDTLSDMRGWLIDGLHLLVTSRDEPDIREVLCPEITMRISMNSRAIDEDIACYLVDHLRSNRRLQKFKSWFSEIEESLVERAQGIFRWVQCQLSTLVTCPSSEFHLRKALRSLPRSLDETYNRMLNSIDPELMEDVRRILTWLCFSRHPLTVKEVFEALTIRLGDDSGLKQECQFQDPGDLVQICPGMLRFTHIRLHERPPAFKETFGDIVQAVGNADDDDDIVIDDSDSSPRADLDWDGIWPDDYVHIAHFSVKEYLESSRIQEHSCAKFALSRQTADTELATSCIIYLRNIELTKSLLTKYAADYWPEHYKQADQSSDSLNAMVTKIFRSPDQDFRRWVKDYTKEASLLAKGNDYKILAAYAVVFGLYRPLKARFEFVSGREDIHIVNECLRLASEHGHVDIARLLLDEGANVNSSGSSGVPLILAVAEGHEHMVQFLLDNNADTDTQITELWNYPSYLNRTPRPMSARHYDLDNVDGFTQDMCTYYEMQQSWSALCQAIWGGNQTIVQLLVEHGAVVDDLAVILASAKGHEHLIPFLLCNGAKVTNEAVEQASRFGHASIVQMLFTKGGQVTRNALLLALVNGHGKTGKLLTERYCVVESSLAARDCDRVQLGLRLGVGRWDTGWAVVTVSDDDYKELVQLLLESGGEITQPVMDKACSWGTLEKVEYLLAKGIQVTRSAVEKASEHGRTQIVKLLLEKGGKISDQAMTMASADYWEDFEQLLSTQRWSIMSRDEQEPTVQSRLDTVELLLQGGGKISGYSILRLIDKDHKATLQFLLERGVGVSMFALANAVSGDHVGVMRVLLASATNVSGQDLKVAMKGEVMKEISYPGQTSVYIRMNNGDAKDLLRKYLEGRQSQHKEASIEPQGTPALVFRPPNRPNGKRKEKRG